MKLTITMNLNNAAFGDDEFERAQEIRDQLARLITLLEYAALEGIDRPIRDANGAKVGRLVIK